METTCDFSEYFEACWELKSKRVLIFEQWALQRTIKTSALLSGAKTLERFAYATPGRNRLMGTKGHNDTVNWLYNELTALGDYYNVTLQPWEGRVQINGSASFVANGVNQPALVGGYSPSTTGTITAPVINVANLGCNPVSGWSRTARANRVDMKLVRLSNRSFWEHCLNLKRKLHFSNQVR
jgi:hypothetical protein